MPLTLNPFCAVQVGVTLGANAPGKPAEEGSEVGAVEVTRGPQVRPRQSSGQLHQAW